MNPSERQADALEALADQSRIQNALLLEIVHEKRARRRLAEGKMPHEFSTTGAATAIEDRALELAEKVDLESVALWSDDEPLSDGGADTGTPPDDRRYRVVCDACDFESRGNYGNRLVAGAEADRHDERAHGGEQSAEVETMQVAGDGGDDVVGCDESAEPTHECAHCGATYNGRGAAMQCCSDQARTDGGQPEDGEEIDVDRELFEEAVSALEAAETSLEELASEVSEIDTGLTHSDTVALLYGRANSLNKTEIRDGFDTLEDVRSKSTRTLLKRLISDQSSELNLSEADAFLDELERLERRYGGDQE